jgi:hypothetical protein
MLRLVQLKHPTEGRRVGVVEEPEIRLLSHHDTVYHLARAAIDSGRGLADLAQASRSPQTLEYDAVYEMRRRGSGSRRSTTRRSRGAAWSRGRG